jgi:protein TonB
MQDRVGEILDQRAALESGAGVGIALSLLLHGAMTAVAAWAALHHPAAQTAGVVNIQFAPIPRTSTPSLPPAAAPKKAAPKPVLPAPTIHEPAPLVEQPKPAATKPIPKTVPTSPFGKSNKTGSDAPAPPPPAPPVTQTSAKPGNGIGAGDVPIGGAGVTGLEGGDFPYTLYIERMKSLVGGHWFRPQVTPGTTTLLYFVINRDGTIRDAKVETPSGNPTFDRAALRAILESSPLPPLPFGYSGTFLGVHLTFK